MRFDGRVLRRQTKSVPTHWHQDVIALHSLITADHIHCRKDSSVTSVQSFPRRIRKHPQNIRLGFTTSLGCGIGLFFLPTADPFFLDFCWIIFFTNFRLVHGLILHYLACVVWYHAIDHADFPQGSH